MSFKKMVVKTLIDFTNEWNNEIHQAIEERVMTHSLQTFPPREDECPERREKQISDSRAFYYARMSTTASLLIAGAAFLLALIAILLTIIPLFR